MNNFKINNNIIDKKDIYEHSRYDLNVYMKKDYQFMDVKIFEYGKTNGIENITDFLESKFKSDSYKILFSTYYEVNKLTNIKKYMMAYTILFKNKKDLLKFKLGCVI